MTKKNEVIKEDEFRHRNEKGKRLMQDEQRVTESRYREKVYLGDSEKRRREDKVRK